MLVVNRLTVCFTGCWPTRPGGFALYLFLPACVVIVVAACGSPPYIDPITILYTPIRQALVSLEAGRPLCYAVL